ncbi:MAG: radical SAM protein [Nitrospirae bacterium]|nr:radical SAM protein [Nitrospirota bacterium]
MRETETVNRENSVLAKVRRTVFEKCIPINATLEITLRCNLRCHHCYNFDRAEPYSAHRAGFELATAEIFRIIDELAEAGTLYLNLTGGEATLRPDLMDIIRRARQRHMMVKIKSNGLRLDPSRARDIASAGAYGADISLYGFSEATYASFTRTPGSFRRALLGIGAAREAGLRVHLSICILRTNLHEIETMADYAKSQGLPYSLDPQITARYDGTKNSSDLRVDAATLASLYRGILRETVTIPNSPPHLPPQCSCARSTCGITAFGEVYPCIGAPLAAGNLRESSFADIWAHSPVLQRIRGLTLEDFPTCKPCSYRAQCRRSSGAVYSITGDYTGAEDWTCMEAEILHTIARETPGNPAPSASPQGSVRRFSVELN